MICLSCHGPNDLTLGYVSRDSSLIIGQLERIKGEQHKITKISETYHILTYIYKK